jgi:tRNA wybutosine-synthesizing protein 3
MARGLLSGVSIRMEVPWCDSNRILLSKEYVRFPVDLAHRKIGRELKRFLVVLEKTSNGLVEFTVLEND